MVSTNINKNKMAEDTYEKVGDIPSMTSKEVHKFLQKIGKNWQGKGCAMELGSWLGGSATSLLQGLVEANYDLPFYAFDKWKVNSDECKKARKQGTYLNKYQDIEPLFFSNVSKIYPNVITHKGGIENHIKKFKGGLNIEICIFDAPKKNPVFSKCMEAVLPHFIPGVTVLGLMDYHHHKKFKGAQKDKLLAPVNFIENNKDCFEMIEDFKPAESVFFKYIKQIEL